MKTIEDIRQRCVITDDGHWLWKGSTRPDGRPNIYAPDYTIAGGAMRTQCGMRAVWHCLHREAVPAGYRVVGVCEEKTCCNPDCIRCWSEEAFGRWIRRSGAYKGQTKRILANRATSRGRSVLTLELITHIQTSPKLGYELAAELGISTTSVSKARRGDAIVFQSAGVFSGLMQGTRETTHAGRA